MTLGITLAGLVLLGTACYQDPEVEVVNSCGETIMFAHFDETHWAPEARDQVFAELEWRKIKQGDSIKIDFTGSFGEPTTLTVVAEDAPLVWDPIEADVEWEFVEWESGGYWDPKKIQLIGDVCGSPT